MIDYKKVFRALPHNYILFAPNVPTFTILDATDGFLNVVGLKREDVEGKDFIEVFPDNPTSQHKNSEIIIASYTKVVQSKRSDAMPVLRYDVKGGGQFDIRYWSPETNCLLDDNGEVDLLIHTTVDISALLKKGVSI